MSFHAVEDHIVASFYSRPKDEPSPGLLEEGELADGSDVSKRGDGEEGYA